MYADEKGLEKMNILIKQFYSCKLLLDWKILLHYTTNLIPIIIMQSVQYS